MEGFGEIEIMLFKKIKWPYIKATQLHSYPGVRMLEPGSLVDKLWWPLVFMIAHVVYVYTKPAVIAFNVQYNNY